MNLEARSNRRRQRWELILKTYLGLNRTPSATELARASRLFSRLRERQSTILSDIRGIRELGVELVDSKSNPPQLEVDKKILKYRKSHPKNH